MMIVECTDNFKTLEPLMDMLPKYKSHNVGALLYYHDGMIQVVRRITAEEMIMRGDPKYPEWNLLTIEVDKDAVLIPLFHAGIKKINHPDTVVPPYGAGELHEF